MKNVCVHWSGVPSEVYGGDARPTPDAPGDANQTKGTPLNDRADEDGQPAEERHSGPPSEDRVRLELVLFAEFIQRLEKSGSLMKAVPLLLSRLGDLRRVLFDYEVRGTERLLPIEDPKEREARRILRQIEESKREMLEDLGRGWGPEEKDDEEGDQEA